MAVDSKHPLYVDQFDNWQQMTHTFAGEKTVKEQGVNYLPPTSGQEADGMDTLQSPGYKSYKRYRARAVFPEYVEDAVEAMLGVMHHKPPVIELPDAMEPLRERATLRNESLEMLLRRINEQQLINGRLGLLVDLLAEPVNRDQGDTQPRVATGVEQRDLPYISLYHAQNIINWDTGRRDGIQIENANLVVLDESEYERTKDFNWEWQEKFRVLVLGDPELNEPSGGGLYQFATYRNSKTFSSTDLQTPSRIGQPVDFIPFTFINASDVVPEPDKPPLLGLSNLCLTVYRGEADFRQALYMQGQDTLVITGAGSSDEDIRIGAEGRLDLPEGATAEYIGVDSGGLREMADTIDKDKNHAMQKGGQLMDSVSRERESGDALKVRVAARTATLNQIALTGAFGLEMSLKQAAEWMGLDPDQVTVTPNLDFIDSGLEPDDIVKLITAKNQGAPISNQTIHKWMEERDATDLEFEEEMDIIEAEEPIGLAATLTEGLNEGGDDDAEQEEGQGSEEVSQ